MFFLGELMLKNKTIYLIRHAQSAVNVDRYYLKDKTNVSAPLTELGLKQADNVGFFLSEELKNLEDIVVWNSPYLRTRQTANAIKTALTSKSIKYKEKESIYLSERQFGLIDDNIEHHITHKHEFDHYSLYSQNKQDFWARPPLGESPYDMCLRLDSFIRLVLSSSEEKHHVIVSHGAALRGFLMMYYDLTYEEYANMHNPPNTSVFKLTENYKLIYEPKEV
jgi:broad specificity phosphatase PhoE